MPTRFVTKNTNHPCFVLTQVEPNRLDCMKTVFWLIVATVRSEDETKSWKPNPCAAKEHMEKTKPDIVIAVDDNASKYLVMPYLRTPHLLLFLVALIEPWRPMVTHTVM